MIFKLKDKFQQTFIVSDKIYKGFIKLFNDNNPLHTQSPFAHHHGFDEKIMHGNILSGFLSYFIGECLPIKNVIIQTQQIQFKAPVYLNDEIFFEAIVDGIFPSINTVEFKFNFRNTDDKIVSKGKIQIGILT